MSLTTACPLEVGEAPSDKNKASTYQTEMGIHPVFCGKAIETEGCMSQITLASSWMLGALRVKELAGALQPNFLDLKSGTKSPSGYRGFIHFDFHTTPQEGSPSPFHPSEKVSVFWLWLDWLLIKQRVLSLSRILPRDFRNCVTKTRKLLFP